MGLDRLVDGAVSIGVAIVGVALLAVLVSRNSNTAGVISASGSAFARGLNAATGPVTGSTFGAGMLSGVYSGDYAGSGLNG